MVTPVPLKDVFAVFGGISFMEREKEDLLQGLILKHFWN
jgi:hypothetical protein